MTLSATLSVEEATEPLWDVIVIGAGPAGATAALALAREGAATLLVDRQCFPRTKVCGGCLNGRALGSLTSLGLDYILPRSQATQLRHFVVQAKGRRVSLDLPCGAAIERSAFDAEIVGAAIQAGAMHLPETTASVCRDYPRGAPFRTVELSHRGRADWQAKARIILAADGLGNSCLRQLERFSCRVSHGARVGLGLVLHDGEQAYRTGAIYMGISRAGYAGLARTADGNLTVAAAVDPEALRASRTPAKLINCILRDAGLAELSATATQPWQGTLPLTRSSSCLAAERVFVLGDAAGYIEPFTGEGMGWAIASAISVAPYVIRSVHGWDERFAKEWEAAQRLRIARGQLACRLLAHVLRRPTTVGLVLGALRAIPALANPLVRRIHLGPATLQAMRP